VSEFNASGSKNVLLYNPVAGRIRKRPHLIREAAALMEQRLGPIEVAPTTGPHTAGAIARRFIEQGAELIIVAGGDGTLNEAAAGIAGSKVPMMLLPAGTANVVCSEAGIGNDTLRAAARIEDLQPRDVALGVLTREGFPERRFLAMAGAGLDARIVRIIPPHIKSRWGKLSYWYGGFAQLGKPLREFPVRWEGGESRASFALISRVKNYGGDLEIARHADLLSDEFGVVLFKGPSSIPYLKYFSGVLLNGLKDMRGVQVFHARSLEIGASDGDVDLQVDGEYEGVAPARVQIAPEKIRLMLPRRFLGARA
jgi:diacylglycerol kinase (ATP)